MDYISTLMLIFILLGLLISLWNLRQPRYPPGPRGLPIIGNMLMLDQVTHRGLAKLADKYGGLVHLKMGLLHMVAVSSPEYAKQVFQVQDNLFSNRPANIASAYLSYDRADMAFAHQGPLWRQLRKICSIKLFSRQRAESWQAVREEVDKMVGNIAKTNNGITAVNVGEQVSIMAMNVTYRAAFGMSFMDGQDEFIAILQDFSTLSSAFNIADFFPYLGWIDPQRINHRLFKARNALDNFIDKIIDHHVSTTAVEIERDMVDELLSFYDEDAEVKMDHLQNSAIKLTKDNIKAIIMDVMFGGTGTVASAIEWAMADMMHNPDERQLVQDELTRVVGLHRRVNESDLENLTYLKCALKETFRLHPPIPLLLHETAEDTLVSGYFIPARTRVMVNAWALGRDSNSWEDPEAFKPSRFLKESAPDFIDNNFEFVPFGSGRRSCPGMQLGLYGLEVAVANLLHCFTWELPGGMKASEMDMGDVNGLTSPKATRLVAVPTVRLLCPLY